MEESDQINAELSNKVLLDEKSSKIQLKKSSFSFFSTHWSDNKVDNQEAVPLYSRNVIFFFTLVFSSICGGILMVMNLRRLNKKEGISEILICSFLYPLVTLPVMTVLPIPFIINIFSSFALANFFWKKHIGVDTEYSPRPIWTAFLIALGVICMMLILGFASILWLLSGA